MAYVLQMVKLGSVMPQTLRGLLLPQASSLPTALPRPSACSLCAIHLPPYSNPSSLPFSQVEPPAALSFPWHCPRDPLSSFCLLLLCRLMPRLRPAAGYTVQSFTQFLCCLFPALTKQNLLLGTLGVPPTPSKQSVTHLYIFRPLPLGKPLLTSSL